MGEDVRGKTALMAAVSALGLSLGVSAVGQAQPAQTKDETAISFTFAKPAAEAERKGPKGPAGVKQSDGEEGEEDDGPGPQALTGAESNQKKVAGAPGLEAAQIKLSGRKGGVRGLESAQQKLEANQIKIESNQIKGD
jgi:hypothetical protein